MHKHRKRIDWVGLGLVLLICVPNGLLQLYTNLILPNEPAWFFDPKTISGIAYKEHFVLEDVLFIPACTLIVHCFAHLTRNVKDYLRHKYILHTLTVSIVIGLLAFGYVTGGKAAEQLHNAFMLPCLAIGIFFVLYNKIKINFTHMYLCFLFLFLLSNGWEFVDKAVFKIWAYNPDCELLSKLGFFFGFYSAISIQYTITGAIVFYMAWIFKKARHDAIKNQMITCDMK
jgi:hypothetical protein